MSPESPRVAFLINPVAGGGRAVRGWDLLRGCIPSWIEHEEHLSRHPGHAAVLSQQFAKDGVDAVVALGGDGTIHEVANGLMREGMQDGEYSGPSFGVLPLGRGNDLARTFGIDTDPISAWRRQQPRLAKPRRMLDVGIVRNCQAMKTTYFINMCGAGIDADVAATANRLPRVFGGTIPYLVGVFAGLVNLRVRNMTVRVSGVVDVPEVPEARWPAIRTNNTPQGREVVISEQLIMTAVGVGRYLGGGMKLLPHNVPGDGFLDVMLVRSKGRFLLLRLLAASFKGQHLSDPDVAYYRARSVTISGPADTNVHADGDPVAAQRAEFYVLPKILPVLF